MRENLQCRQIFVAFIANSPVIGVRKNTGRMMQCGGHAMIIDSDELSREGLRRIVASHFQVVWCSDEPASSLVPGCADHASPLVLISTDGAEANAQIAKVRDHYPSARIALLMEQVWQEHDARAFRRCGAHSVIPRTASFDSFISTLMLVHEGRTVLPGKVANLMFALPPQTESHEPSITHLVRDNQIVLSAASACAADLRGDAGGPGVTLQEHNFSLREKGVLAGVRAGLSNKEIARDLGITEATVKVHVKAILRKARLRNRTQVAIWASQETSAARELDVDANRLDGADGPEPRTQPLTH